MRLVIAPFLIALALACGASPAPPAATSDTATASETATANDTASDAPPDAGTADVPPKTDAAADTKPADTSQPDASPTDAVIGELAATDVAQAEAGQVDAAPKPDAAPEVDAGPLADGDADSEVAPVGPASCASACKNIETAACPNEQSYDKCVSGCTKAAQSVAPNCTMEFDALTACMTMAKIVCKPSGKIDESVCSGEIEAVEKCSKGGTGPGCGAGPCYAGGGPGGVTSCGCSTTCNGSEYKLDCDGQECKCTQGGVVTAQFPQGNTCEGNVSATLKANCGVPNP